jgi:hypothetical protein
VARVVGRDRDAREARRGARAMTTLFRNVDSDRDEPLDSWPMEAIETIIERGSLSD